ncbi:MAG: hypothetical protein ABIW76_07635 [Fibrobacteria bacterium]
MYQKNFQKTPLLLSLLLMVPVCAQTRLGFLVRFLPNPEPATKYTIYRTTAPGMPRVKIGEIPAVGKDTLEFEDLGVERGVPYFYSMTSTFAATGLESEFSGQSAVAYPKLNLPDTLRSLPGIGSVQFIVEAKNDPLAGIAPIQVVVDGTTPFNYQFSAATKTMVITPKVGQLMTSAKIIIRAGYYGQFQDIDTVLVLVTGGVGIRPTEAFLRSNPSPIASPLENGTVLFSNLPENGELRVYTLQGVTAFQSPLRKSDGTLLWNGVGKDVGSQLLSFRVIDRAGRVTGSGRIRLNR